MKVLHVPYGYFPDATGGTEVYVRGLCRALKERGIEAIVAAPGETNSSYEIEGVRVRRLAVSGQTEDVSEFYGKGDPAAAGHFAAILDEECPDLVHLHGLTRAVSVLSVMECRKRSLPVVFTYHTPTASCQRGTLMRWGRTACEGQIRVRTCASCVLEGLGVPRPWSDLVGRTPRAAGRLLEKAHLSGGLWTALRMRHLMDIRKKSFERMVREVDHWIAPSEWARRTLLLNGVSSGKISLSPQGVTETLPGGNFRQDRTNGHNAGPLRIAFLGRLDPTKGIHVLVQAFSKIKSADLELDIYGLNGSEAAGEYLKRVRRLAAGDGRIQFHPAIPHDEVTERLGHYDLLAVPSQWLETGPLVVLEAFAAGIPVIGSDLGGTADLVRHGVNGLLVPAGSVPAWAEALEKCVRDPGLVRRLRRGIVSPRSMEEVADEMIGIYEDVYAEIQALSCGAKV